MKDTPPALETIFNAAKALPPASRADYLNVACKDNATLREEVQRLLAAADSADDFFAARPVGLTQPENTVVDATVQEGPGTRIGRYKLLQQIGEGGMGSVYMAEQEEPVRRRVALKIIKLGMDTKSVVARFEAERQALAMMDHPNIARVLDGGTTDTGRPYFVMELVQGVPLIEFCDKARLPARDRLDLFIQVCQAVQSAHQKGIIHRDLKPSNILVTQHHGKPMPKVIDFGIAKATNQKLTEKTLFTQHATMIGTPAYMSPEQAELTSMDVDTRSDIYSLGVLLYELLTGTTPFPEKRLRSLGYGEMQRVIAEEEPERPSARLSTLGHEQKTVLAKNRGEELAALNTRLRGDLDWIVMKCLEKNRTRRYETANGLAADLKHHLDNEPVTARPPSLGYRVQKTLHRHRGAFATAGIVLVALLLGLGVSIWQAVEKTRALARMTEAEQAQSHSREVAEKALTQEAEARRRVDELLEREKTLRQAGEARVYATDIHLAQQAIDQDNFDRARDLLARYYPRAGQTNRPGWEWRHLWQQVRSEAAFEVWRFPGFTGLAVGASASSGTRWLASRHRDDRRAWIELLDVTHLQAPRKAGEIVLPSSNVISALAIGSRNGLIAHAQAASTFLLMSPEPLATIAIHDAATRRTLATLTNLAGLCLELQWSGDGRHLLSSRVGVDREGSGRRVDVWRAPDLTHVATLKDFPKLERGLTGFSVAMTTDASAVAVAGPNYPLSVLDVATGAVRWSLPSQARGFRELASDGKTLFAAEDADPWVLRVFDFLTGKELSPPLAHEDGGGLGSLVVASDGRTLVARSLKGNLCLWEVGDPARGLKALPPLRAPSDYLLDMVPGERTALTFSEGRVLAWDLARERQLPQPLKVAIDDEPKTWRLGADNRTLLIAARNGAVTQRHGPALQSETPLFHLGRSLGMPVFSEDGRWFAAGSADGFVEVWDVQERRQVQKIGRYPGTVRAVQFSPDGSRLIVADWANERYVEWDLATSREIRTFPTIDRDGFDRDDVLTRDGQQMLGPDGKGGILWMDTQSREERGLGPIPSKVTELVFAPDGLRFAVLGGDQLTRVLDRRNFETIATLGDRKAHMISMQFMDRGNRMVLGSDWDPSPIALWDVATGLELVHLGTGGVCNRLDVSADGNVVVAGIAGKLAAPVKELQLWRAPSWDEIERAEAALPDISSVRPR
jgi:serine/threonine protein kinase/WD40 repeat protein